MLRRLLIYSFGAVALVVMSSPLALYWLGLSGVEGLPSKPTVLASQERQLWVWKEARGKGVPSVTPLNPYSYVFRLIANQSEPNHPGNLVAWWVASDYLSEHQRFKGMGWWHLSGAALTIWLSQNWSSEEMLSEAVASLQHRGLTN